jgi:hypothetical protein
LNNGIAEFDGSNWAIYNQSNSDLPDNDVRAIAVDANDNKWIGTYSGGTAVFNKNGISNVGIAELKRSGSVLHISAHPNPFKDSTTFSYKMPQNSSVKISILNSYGQLVGEALNTYQQKGEQKTIWNAGNLPAGVYFYTVEAGTDHETGKIIVLR